MTLLIIIAAIGLLVTLVSWLKLHPFLAFLIVSIAAGFALGLPITRIAPALEKGIGDVLSSLVILLGCGAMFGKLIVDSGAAQQIAKVVMQIAGRRYIQWAMMLIGFIVGIPLFYGVGFVLMVPLAFSVVYKYKLPAVVITLPMLAALSVTHGFLPPHPSPSALVVQFGANMGMTLVYGVAIAIPAIIIAGPLFAHRLKNIHAVPLRSFIAEDKPEEYLPGRFISFFTALLPVLLLAVTAFLPMLDNVSEQTADWMLFFGSPSIVLLLSLIIGTITLGLRAGKSMTTLMNGYIEALKEIAPILLIIAGSGALKEVLTQTGINVQLAGMLNDSGLEPLILGWVIAALIRICIGSATVAGLTTAGIIAPLMAGGHTDPNLMVLSIGAGSLACSHVNDSGFWMFKEYFNLTVKDTLLSWSVMETIVAVVGLAGVLLLNQFI